VEAGLEIAIGELERKLAGGTNGFQRLALTPSWWQQYLLERASQAQAFRVRLLRFVDVLPTLRSPSSVADHFRQYFQGSAPEPVRTASALASQPIFRPMLSQAIRRGVSAMARRFIAGATPAEALPALRHLAKHGVGHTVDLLGEATLSDAEADAYQARYLALLQTFAADIDRVAPLGERWQGVPAINVSVKCSALCSHFEPAAPEHVSAVVRDRLRSVLRLACQMGAFINLDMEQHRYKDLVHRIFADLILEPEFADVADVGIVVQAYQKDALDDLSRLEALAKRRGVAFTIRLVKGAYWDEERIVASQNSWPVPVFEEKAETDASFERCTDSLLGAWPHLRPAFGTHNPRSIAQAVAKARAAGLPDSQVEFQMLYGMAEGVRAAVAAEGYRTRVYVPVGEIIPGMAYLVRRLLENSSNQAWFHTGLGHAAPVPMAKPKAEIVPAPVDTGFRNAGPVRFFDPDARRRMSEALTGMRGSFGGAYPLLIGERRVSDRPQAEVHYAAEPETVLGQVAQASPADVDAAVALAREAVPFWRDRPAAERAAVLRRAADMVEERRYGLAAVMVYESGKPWLEADSDVAEAIDYLRYYAQEAERCAQPKLMGAVLGEHNECVYQGRGVAAIIAPWNFPLAIITGMSSAALAAGNAAILKPAEPSPIIAYRLVEILREAGVPPEIVQYVPGMGERVGRALVEHPGIDIIAFTGSTAVGQSILAAAAQVRPGQRNVKRVIAEMGGKNAIIIDDDADLDEAIAGTVASAFGYAGQKCSACSRLVVVGSAYEDVLQRLRHAVASLIVGPPDDPATVVPPVINGAARDKIAGYIEIGRRTSRVLVEGSMPSGSGYYVRPTVFTDVPLDSPIACEEIFGPVLAVFDARNFDEAIEIATSSSFALTGGVFSRSPRHIDQARAKFRVGNLYVNRKITGAIVGRQPFGGLAMSGTGDKAGGPDYLLQFMEPRVVTENTTRRGFAPD
jgi:RHH-type proline utilization regulon transcriptional repressor/proline dehydrogenase/delta 1-pyrroline-5-carboxylate dehydrogenase